MFGSRLFRSWLYAARYFRGAVEGAETPDEVTPVDVDPITPGTWVRRE